MDRADRAAIHAIGPPNPSSSRSNSPIALSNSPVATGSRTPNVATESPTSSPGQQQIPCCIDRLSGAPSSSSVSSYCPPPLRKSRRVTPWPARTAATSKTDRQRLGERFRVYQAQLLDEAVLHHRVRFTVCRDQLNDLVGD